MGRITPSFRQTYHRLLIQLMRRNGYRASLRSLRNVQAFDTLLREAWSRENAAMGNAGIPCITDNLILVANIHNKKRIEELRNQFLKLADKCLQLTESPEEDVKTTKLSPQTQHTLSTNVQIQTPTLQQPDTRHIIFHVDMDYFFAAIEEREHPDYKGNPVVVGANPDNGRGRGVVSTCNYEARKFGLHSGMPISQAWKLCPTAIYLSPNYSRYKEVSEEIMKLLHEYAADCEPWGIDEAFLNMTPRIENYMQAERLAERLKQELLEGVRLTCSIGIGPNKLIAKIASDYRKPDGLTIVPPNKIHEFLSPLPIRRLIGVGEKTEIKLNAMGITTIGDLLQLDLSTLTTHFGRVGNRFYQMLHGPYSREVNPKVHQYKSMSKETTFATDTMERGFIMDKLESLIHKAHTKIMKRRLLFKTITVKIRYDNFFTHTRAKTLTSWTNRHDVITAIASQLIQQHMLPDRKIRLIGIKLSNIITMSNQRTLFNPNQ